MSDKDLCLVMVDDSWGYTCCNITGKDDQKFNIFLSFCTSLLLVCVGFFLIMNKKFERHPYLLIGIACLAESNTFWPARTLKCWNGNGNALGYISGLEYFGIEIPLSVEKWMNRVSLHWYWVSIYQSFMIVHIANLSIVYNLTVSLKNPF